MSVTVEPDDVAMRLARRSADAMYASDRAAHALGMKLVDVGPGRAVVEMTVTAEMLNGHAMAHGGYVFLLADTAFAYACNTYGSVTVAAGADVSFVASAREGDVLTAHAEERSRYGRSGLYDVTVSRGDEAVAEFRGRSRALGISFVDG